MSPKSKKKALFHGNKTLYLLKSMDFMWFKGSLVEIQLTHFMNIKVYIASIVKRQVRPNCKSPQNLRRKHYFNVIKTLYLLKIMDFTWFKGILVEIQLTHFMNIKVYIASIVKRQVRPNCKSPQNLRRKHFFNVIKTLYLLKIMDFTWFKGILVEIQLTHFMNIKVYIASIVKRQVRPNYKSPQNLNRKHYFNVIKTLYLLRIIDFTWFKAF